MPGKQKGNPTSLPTVVYQSCTYPVVSLPHLKDRYIVAGPPDDKMAKEIIEHLFVFN
jgi:hypothetical protein